MIDPLARRIIFDAESIRAILAGTKTQTRRVMQPQPSEDWQPTTYGEVHKRRGGEFVMRHDVPVVIGWGPSNDEGDEAFPCPYYAFEADTPRLWVREAWAYPGSKWTAGDDVVYHSVRYLADDARREVALPRKRVAEAVLSQARVPRYKGPYPPETEAQWKELERCEDAMTAWWNRRISPLFMPRWASRLTLDVAAVRVERLDQISEADARAEGCEPGPVPGCGQGDYWCHGSCRRHGACQYQRSARAAYRARWDAINGRKQGAAWADNPWVWVIAFPPLARDGAQVPA